MNPSFLSVYVTTKDGTVQVQAETNVDNDTRFYITKVGTTGLGYSISHHVTCSN
jgi:hypothetical protein